MRPLPLLAFVLTLAVGVAAQAEKPDGKGGGHGRGHGQGRGEAVEHGRGQSRQDSGPAANISFSFGDRDRVVVRDYFDAGRGCPPGLAKKNNGCMPPGQAKKWVRGQPLPRDVVWYELPRELTVRLTAPPAGHRYVRVAADILMIAAGTGMVVAALEDLGRL